MVVSQSLELIFINIPNTGGNTVEDTLGLTTKTDGRGLRNGKAMHHYRWDEYIIYLGGYRLFKRFFKMSIVRNPYTRFIAHYFYCQIPNLGHKSLQKLDDFISYAEDIVTNKKYDISPLHVNFCPQYRFLYDEFNNLKMDVVFRFERYGDIYTFLKDICCVDTMIKNHATKFPYHIKLTPIQEKRIKQMYYKDFKVFNYSLAAYDA